MKSFINQFSAFSAMFQTKDNLQTKTTAMITTNSLNLKTLLLYFLTITAITSCEKDDSPINDGPIVIQEAEFSIDQNDINFGEVEIETIKEVNLTVTNTGGTDLELNSYGLSGLNASEFIISPIDMPIIIEPSTSYDIVVTLEPTEEGGKTAILTITSSIGEHQINLSGNAVFNPNLIVNIPDANFKAKLLEHGVTITGPDYSVIDTNNDGEIQSGEALAYGDHIICGNAGISDITGIEAFKNIVSLRAHANQLTNVDLSENIELEDLVLDDNQITDLDVSNNTKLRVLYCQTNQLANIDITNSPALQRIYLASNQLTSINTSQNPELTVLVVSTNQITALDVTSNTQLRNLWFHVNSVTSIDVSQNTNLTSLVCYFNSLTSLDVSNNTQLVDLSCGANGLSNLDVSQNTLLEELRINTASITSLDVSTNTNLVLLGCSSNQLTSLDISQNTALVTLGCSNNALTFLNLANGNNNSLASVTALNNNLTCIQIDPGYTPGPPNNWVKDASANYSISCP